MLADDDPVDRLFDYLALLDAQQAFGGAIQLQDLPAGADDDAGLRKRRYRQTQRVPLVSP